MDFVTILSIFVLACDEVRLTLGGDVMSERIKG